MRTVSDPSVARRPHRPGLDGPLVLCYDGSEGARHAIERAGDLLGGRRALVVTVWQAAAGLGSLAFSGATTNMIDYVELDRAAAEEGDRLAREGARIAQEAGLLAEPRAVKAVGSIWKTIVEIADLHDAAAIVIGSRGLTTVRSMLLGSVSNAVMHHSDRPTLVIHRARRSPLRLAEGGGDGR